MTYAVIATIQSTLPFSTEPPVEMRYYTGDNLAKAISAAASAATDDTTWVKTLSVRIDFI